MPAYWTLAVVICAGGSVLTSPEPGGEVEDIAAETDDETVALDGPETDGELTEEPVEDDADAHVRAASEAYQAGDFDRAASEIARAYELAPSPNLLFPWAQAERQRGDCSTAIKLYARYLAEEPGETTAALARDHIETCVASLETESTADQPTARVPTKTKDSADRTWIRDPVGGALVGGGVLFMGVGLGMMVGARSMMIDALESDHANYASEADRAVTVDRFGIAGLSIGAALVVGGVVRYVLVHRKNRRQSTARVDIGRDLRLHF